MKCFIYISLLVFALTEAKWSRFRPNIVPLNIDVMKSEYVNNSISRIVGGEEAHRHAHPHQAALFVFFDEAEEEMYIVFCGGSIISKDFILTAADCVHEAVSVEVLLGAHNIFEDEESQIRLKCREFKLHPEWKPKNLKSPNIALIKLPESIEFDYKIQPIKLPKYSNENLNGRPAVISGWGRDSDKSDDISPVLREVNTNVMALWLCKLFFLGVPGDNHICTRGRGGKGACHGDAGGPMVILDEEDLPSSEESQWPSTPPPQFKKTLHGIVSFGLGFGCELGWPTVFTRVGAYVDWIRVNADIIGDNDYE